MLKSPFVFVTLSIWLCVTACAASDTDFRLALVTHAGQLSWSADGYKVLESSAKPNGNEIGIRGKNGSGITFLGFLFLVPEQAPLTGEKCRDGALKGEKSNPSLKIQNKSEISSSGNLPVSLVSYAAQGRGGKVVYTVRGFVATADICGDLEFYSDSPITAEDVGLKKVFATYTLDAKYTPTFRDALLYGQILYNAKMYKAAGPVFETALGRLNASHEVGQTTMKRVITDQAGMAYGVSGDLQKARSIFEKAIAEDPEYPLYYYNLACADAEEKDLAGAQKHLREAFDRKANIIAGEEMPDPTTDDSFLPYRDNRAFWSFLQGLQAKK
jgi:tetratricopeptide (TPR) repeat protein